MARYGRTPDGRYEVLLRTACGCSKLVTIGAVGYRNGEHRESISNEPVTEICKPLDYNLSVRVFKRRVYDDVHDIWEFWEEGHEVLSDRVLAEAINHMLAKETVNVLLDKRPRPSANDPAQWDRWKGNTKC
jgi:hypothetical protein